MGTPFGKVIRIRGIYVGKTVSIWQDTLGKPEGEVYTVICHKIERELEYFLSDEKTKVLLIMGARQADEI